MAAEQATVIKQEGGSAPGLHVLAKPSGPKWPADVNARWR